ncbi:hypothetical protein [Nonomuraea dietziae]|uniref:sensor histidine kinase n=1 Tax=Nonomuraea dietziae TaxID=65515 RepID=UPI0031D28616
MLGVLREDPQARAPQATLADLDELIRTSGADVTREVGDLSAVPAVISREAYRIVQEALTNAIKHGHGTVRLAAAVREDQLSIEVTNAAGAGGHGGGRGVAGMRERVGLLRGTLHAGPVEAGEWQVSVRLPLRSGV